MPGSGPSRKRRLGAKVRVGVAKEDFEVKDVLAVVGLEEVEGVLAAALPFSPEADGVPAVEPFGLRGAGDVELVLDMLEAAAEAEAAERVAEIDVKLVKVEAGEAAAEERQVEPGAEECDEKAEALDILGEGLQILALYVCLHMLAVIDADHRHIAALERGGLDVEVGDAVGELGVGAPVLSALQIGGEEAVVVLLEAVEGEAERRGDALGGARGEMGRRGVREEVVPGSDAALPDSLFGERAYARDVYEGGAKHGATSGGAQQR